MESQIIKLSNGKWFLNDRPFNELNPNEQQCLDNFFSNLKNRFEKVNISIKNLKSHNHKFKNDEIN